MTAPHSQRGDPPGEVAQLPPVDNKMDFKTGGLIKTIIKAVIKMQVQFGPR